MRALFLLFFALPAFAGHLIVVGSGGDKEYRERFEQLGKRLETALVERCGQRPEDVLRLTEKGKSRSDLAGLRVAFARLAKGPADETLFVYFIGHGSFLRGQARFQIPGEDLSPEELNRLLAQVPNKRIGLVLGGSASAPFIEQLSREGRAICSATKSGYEQNATEFMGMFIEALETGRADQDRDQRINLYEATSQAAIATQDWYKGSGLIATEHALLDDNGDKRGSRLTVDPGQPERLGDDLKIPPDGALARTLFLREIVFPKTAPKSLIHAYLAQLAKAQDLIQRKKKMNSDAYYREFEAIMLKAAQLHRDIRKYP